jgi:hypothetical protein
MGFLPAISGTVPIKYSELEPSPPCNPSPERGEGEKPGSLSPFLGWVGDRGTQKWDAAATEAGSTLKECFHRESCFCSGLLL